MRARSARRKEGKAEKVIPLRFIPDREAKVRGVDGTRCLLMNDAFYTFFERSMGEFSPFFLAIRDEKKILGCRCPRCGLVRVPPFVTHCPDCDYAPTELTEVGQVGRLISTPPITYFATSLFLDRAPFGRGRVVLEGADTALSVMLYTTTGILTPGILQKGTEVKVVFRDRRLGEIADIFCVPTAELTPGQIATPGLEESELPWARARAPKFDRPSRDEVRAYRECLREMRALARAMSRSRRARSAILGWKRNIAVRTKAGEFAMVIDDGDLRIVEKKLRAPDFIMACEDPRALLDGLAYRGAFTDAVILKKIWIDKNEEFNTIFKLDRLARFLAREKKERAARQT
ncbi:MAG: hypothetical protein HYV61_11670 [Candidatus Rokubacteria bacterium]|nr:hypothetical protein [Candidatus Rokubacteria bacterium]